MAPWIAAGMFWRRSLGVIPYSPKEAAARSPAAPWSQTADGTAFLGGIPCPSRERIIPAQHISAAAFGHTGVSCGIFKGLPIGKGGDGSVPLQHQHAAVLTGQTPKQRPHDQGQWPSPASAGEIPHREGSGPSDGHAWCPEHLYVLPTAFIPSASKTSGV